MTKPPTHPGLSRAIIAAGNSRRELARIIGCPRSLINWLEHSGKPLSAKYVLVAEQKLGISRHELNPAVFGEKV